MLRFVPMAAASAALVLIAASARADCVRTGEGITGELREVRTSDTTGQPVVSFHVALKSAICVELGEAGDGDPRIIDGVRSIELVLAEPAESLELGELLGAEVEAAGELEAPVETVHTGDAVMLRATVTTIEGARAGGGEDIEPDGVLEARIERFVRGFYLSGDDVDEEQIRLLYGPRVDYFGRNGVSVGEIVRDKIGYYRRWPQRVFSLVEGTLDVRRAGQGGESYDVAFEYDFEVRRAGEIKRGRGVAVLTIDLGDDGGRIVRETGRVLRRM